MVEKLTVVNVLDQIIQSWLNFLSEQFIHSNTQSFFGLNS